MVWGSFEGKHEDRNQIRAFTEVGDWLTVLVPFVSGSVHAAPSYLSTHNGWSGLPNEAFQSVVWHELQGAHQHDATFVSDINLAVLHEMRRARVTTLLELHVKWQIDVVRLDNNRVTGGYFPTIVTREWAIKGTQLVALKEWTTAGTVALYTVNERHADELISIPEISLQQATEMALQPIEAPSWTQNERWVRIPVDIYADDEYRAFYGDSWVTEVRKRINRANALLRPAGLMLDIEATHTWNLTPMDVHCLNLTACEIIMTQSERVHRLTHKTLTRATISPGCGGRGTCVSSGRDLIIADQALAPP